jgi:hypothetical protein
MHAMKIIVLLAVSIVAAAAVAASASASAMPVQPTGVCGDYECFNYDPAYGDGYDYPVEGSADDYAGDSCRTKTVGVTRVNMWGWVMWRYIQRVTWCWSGDQITYINRYRYPSDIQYFWQWQGHVSSSCNEENCGKLAGNYQAFVATTGEFSYCYAMWVGCFKTVLPHIMMAVTAGGGYAWTAGT